MNNTILDNIDADVFHFDELYPCVNESNLKQYYTADDFNIKFPQNNAKHMLKNINKKQIYIYIYICICMYIYICMYMYIYIYMYI